MERRYGRANERYRSKVSAQKKKASFKISLQAQSAVCLILLAAGILMSFAKSSSGISKKITHILYHTNTVSEWKDTVMPAALTVKKGSIKAVAMWTDAINKCEKKLGLTETKENAPVNAKAQKQEEKSKNEKTENKKSESESKSEAPHENPLTFRAPVAGEITSAFGARIHPISGVNSEHTGIDIAAAYGETVISAAPGTVTATGSDDANGSYVIIKHSEELTTVYAHLSKICVLEGEAVDGNTKIGEVGSSGISTGPHVHFEVKRNSVSVNPEDYITLR